LDDLGAEVMNAVNAYAESSGAVVLATEKSRRRDCEAPIAELHIRLTGGVEPAGSDLE
jgi:hypothetical protein